LFDRYVKEIIPTKGLRTQSDNMKELKQLRKAFEKAPIESITPQVVAQYRDARTAKVRANREIRGNGKRWRALQQGPVFRPLSQNSCRLD